MSDPQQPLPLARPVLGRREEELVLEVLRSGQLSLGPVLERFEQSFAEWVGVKHAVAVSSGTAGLHLGVRALGWGRGERVITSPFSFVSSANCLLYEGVRPYFCDIDPVSFNLDPDATEAVAGEAGVSGILPIHIYGFPAATAEFERIARRHGLGLLEDSCEALGAVDSAGRRVGSAPVASVFAFYANKQLTTGEGGMLTCQDPDFAARVRSERNQGRGDDMGWVNHVRLGYNYRLTDLAAAIGLGQLERLDAMLADRERVARLYGEHLAGLEEVVPLLAGRGRERRSWFVYVVQLGQNPSSATDACDPDSNRQATERRGRIIERLGAAGVPAKAYMPCIHLMPHLRELGFREGEFPVAEHISARSLALPFHPGMREQDVSRVARALRGALAEEYAAGAGRSAPRPVEPR